MNNNLQLLGTIPSFTYNGVNYPQQAPSQNSTLKITNYLAVIGWNNMMFDEDIGDLFVNVALTSNSSQVAMLQLNSLTLALKNVFPFNSSFFSSFGTMPQVIRQNNGIVTILDGQDSNGINTYYNSLGINFSCPISVANIPNCGSDQINNNLTVGGTSYIDKQMNVIYLVWEYGTNAAATIASTIFTKIVINMYGQIIEQSIMPQSIFCYAYNDNQGGITGISTRFGGPRYALLTLPDDNNNLEYLSLPNLDIIMPTNPQLLDFNNTVISDSKNYSIDTPPTINGTDISISGLYSSDDSSVFGFSNNLIIPGNFSSLFSSLSNGPTIGVKNTLFYIGAFNALFVGGGSNFASPDPRGYYFTKNHICNPNAQPRVPR